MTFCKDFYITAKQQKHHQRMHRNQKVEEKEEKEGESEVQGDHEKVVVEQTRAQHEEYSSEKGISDDAFLREMG